MHSWTRKTALTLAIAGLAVVALAGCVRVNTTNAGPTSSGRSAASPGSSDAKLPANWPSDVPVPPLPVKNALEMQRPEGPVFTAVFQGPGDPGAAFATLNEQFVKAGFTSSTSLGSNSGGGVAVWQKGDVRVQITVLTQDGQVVISENVMTGRPTGLLSDSSH